MNSCGAKYFLGTVRDTKKSIYTEVNENLIPHRKGVGRDRKADEAY